MLTNEITGNRIQNNAQSAVLVVAVTGCWTESLENASIQADADSELEGRTLTTFESFRRYPAGLCFRHLKKSLNGPCLRVFHAIVSRNRAGLSARFLEYVPLRMYLVQLTFLRATIFSGRIFSWSVKILCSTDCHGHSKMIRLLRLTVCTFGSGFITFLLVIRPVAQSEL